MIQKTEGRSKAHERIGPSRVARHHQQHLGASDEDATQTLERKTHNPGTDGWIGIAVDSSFPLRVFAGPGQNTQSAASGPDSAFNTTRSQWLQVAPSRSINHTRPHKAGDDQRFLDGRLGLFAVRHSAAPSPVSTPSFLFLLTRYGLRTSCVRYAPLLPIHYPPSTIHPCVCVCVCLCLCAPSPRPVRAQSYRSRSSTLLGLAVVPPNQPVSPF